MQKPSGKSLRKGAALLLIILLGVALGYLYRQSPIPLLNRAAGHLRALIYFGLIITWALSVSRRIMQKQVRFYLLFISALMLYWQLARTMRYLFVIENPNLYHFLWYSYYIPIVLIPLIGLFVSLYLGKTENYRLSKWMRILYIPAIFLIGLVLTNELHQQVFFFVEGEAALRTYYQYRFGYWLAFAWMSGFAAAMLGILIVKSRVPRSKKILCLPFAPFFAYLVYAILYAIRVPLIHIYIGDMTVVFCLLIMGIFESCIQVGLIRSNTNYGGLLYASGIAAQIVDQNYQVHYRAAAARELPEETMRRAEHGPIDLDESTRLSSVSITGGHALWLEDVSEMNRMLAELGEVRQRLSENNDLLQAEVELKERQTAVDVKTRLYDRLTKEAAPQLQRLDELLSDDRQSALPTREKLVWLCILGTFIKRRSNLIILSEDSRTLPAKELEYCLLESAEAISSGGIDCTLKRRCDGILSTDDTLLLYDLFEEIVETALPGLSALFISAFIKKGTAEIKLQLNCAKGEMFGEELKNLSRLTKRGGQLSKTWEDGTLHMTIHLPKGGGGK